MKEIKVDGNLGVVTGMKFNRGGQMTVKLAALDFVAMVDSLSQLNSKDERFNEALKIVSAKMMDVSFQMEADFHISSNRVEFQHTID